MSSKVLTIPLAELEVECGETLTIALHTEMVRVVEGEIVQAETGWAYGSDEFSGSRWGWSTAYTSCCPPEDGGELGCTLTQGYWKTHAEAWPLESLDLGAQSYTKDEALGILDTPPEGDASLVLAHQLIAAKLNLATQANASVDVLAAIASADAWLVANADADGSLAFGVDTDWVAGAEAVDIASTLDAYNNGSTATPHCD